MASLWPARGVSRFSEEYASREEAARREGELKPGFGLQWLKHLPTVELALARIRARVAQGGHDVLEAVVRRRFDRGLKNFEQVYKRLVNGWALYDNSGPVPRLLDSGDNP